MKKNKLISSLLSVILISGMITFPVNAADEQILAFPGAEGGGKYTTGARGKSSRTVYHVTNLSDSGTGSLRDAVSEEGRIIVFDVSGIIELESRLDLEKSNLTILGQTAPGDGITVSGNNIYINKANNIIMRYMRIRPTDVNPDYEDDALGGRWADNIILDHCSVSWCVDEALTLYSGSLEDGKESENKAPLEQSKNVTVQYCLSSESLRMSNHFKGAHGYGGIIGGTNATYHHNMFAHHDSRNPRFDRNLKSTDMVNNVIYNWGNNGTYGAEPYSYNKWERYSAPEYASNINIRNNYYKSGPSTKRSIRSKIFEATNDGKVVYNGVMAKSNAYIKDNYVYGNAEVSANNALNESSVMNQNKLNLLDTPIDMGEYTIPSQTAEEAFEEVAANVGATLPRRDSIDARVVADAKNGTGRIINGINEVGGFSGIKSESRVFQIPQDWKTEFGMGSYGETDIVPAGKWAGYTWIEAYVYDWTEKQSAPTNPDITVTAPAVADTTKTSDKTNEKGFWTVINESESVTYTAQAQPKSGTSIEKIEIYDGSKLIDTADGSGVNEEIRLNAGTHYLTSKAYNNKGESTTSPTSIVYVTKNDNSIGNDTIAEIGSTSFEGKNNVWTKNGVTYIGGSGLISGKFDSFSYWKHSVTGDFEFSAKAESIPKFENGALCGIMFRETLDSDSRMVMLSDGWKKYGENISVPMRTEKGGDMTLGWLKDAGGNDIKNDSSYDTSNAEKNLALPKYIKIARKGDKLTLSVSNDGKDWTNNKRQPLEIDISGWSKIAYIGLAVDSINGQTTEATPMLPWYSIGAFSDIKMTGVQSYSAAFETNGGVITDGSFCEYCYGDNKPLPADVKKEGYTFMGWYDNDQFEGEALAAMPPTTAGSVTYYAKWYEGVYEDNSVIWKFSDVIDGEKLVNKDNKEKEWYIKETDLGSGLKAYATDALNTTKKEYSNAFEIDRTGTADFTVGGTKETVTGALKFGGSSSSTGRYMTYTPSEAGVIRVYVRHGSPDKPNTDKRSLVVEQGSKKTSVVTVGTDSPYAAQDIEVEADVEVKITSEGNVALAKMVFMPKEEETQPTSSPTVTDEPITTATAKPTLEPTKPPTATVTANPTSEPTGQPTATASANPTTEPTKQPTAKPDLTPLPSDVPEKTEIEYNRNTKSAEFVSKRSVGSVNVIFACYDTNERLVSVSVKSDAKITQGSNSIKSPDGFNDNGEVKIYIWHSFEEMQPVNLF